MRSVTGEGDQRARQGPALRELRLQQVVLARCGTLRLLLVAYPMITKHSYRPLAQLDVNVEFESPSIALGSPSEFAPSPLAGRIRASESAISFAHS